LEITIEEQATVPAAEKQELQSTKASGETQES
jgi:hypothetical protein